MNCPTDGTLRSRIDQELSAAECASVDEHVRSCPDCRPRLAQITSQATRVRDALDVLAPVHSEQPVNAGLAYARFRQRLDQSMEAAPFALARLLRRWRRPAWATLAAASAITLLLSFAPARSWGQKILDMLRVQKVVVVPVDMSALSAEGDTHSAGKLLAQMISDNVVVTMKPGAPEPAANIETASQAAGFTVRSLPALGTPQKILVEEESAFHMTLDRDRMQDVLDEAGRSDIQIPESANGSTIAVHIPKLVRAVYGTCQSDSKIHAGSASGATTPEGCISFFQVPSPIVSVPPTLNVAALAEAGLQVAGMGAAEAHAFCQTVDWSSTLVIPFPRNGSSRTVQVDGVNGTLLETSRGGALSGEYALLWIKNGIVYSLNGFGTADRALAAVQSIN